MDADEDGSTQSQEDSSTQMAQMKNQMLDDTEEARRGKTERQ